jgi:hypothetical protein
MSPEPPTASHHPWLRVPLTDYEGHMRAPGMLARDFRLIEETYRAVPGGKGALALHLPTRCRALAAALTRDVDEPLV